MDIRRLVASSLSYQITAPGTGLPAEQELPAVAGDETDVVVVVTGEHRGA